MIRAEILTIGDEILYGQILDTNSQWISARLTEIGVQVIRKTSIADRAEDLRKALDEGLSRASLMILTGGLGPTLDDITKPVLAEYFDSEMAINEDALGLIKGFFEKRGRVLLEVNRLQAMIPIKAEYLQNKMGTAPGMWFDAGNQRAVVSLPGVPYEMKYLMEQHVMPRIKERFSLPVILHRYMRTIGLGESFIADKIKDWEEQLPEHIRLAYLPSVFLVKMRLTAMGQKPEALAKELEAQIALVKERLGDHLYALEDVEPIEVVYRLLKEQVKTIGSAESCTGGHIAAQLSSLPGSSSFFMGSVVAYSNEVKKNQLGVSDQTLSDHGAVSEACIVEMAKGLRQRLGTDLALASSGIAGPDGGSDEKPVGTVWIALADEKAVYPRKLNLNGASRENIIRATTLAALNLVRLHLTGKLESRP
jgi:nicotinamide-nucleotide amidase